MAKKSLFSVEESEIKITEEEKSRINIAEFYKDARSTPYGLFVIILLASIFGGVTTLLLYLVNKDNNSKATISVIITIVWILVAALSIYSIIFLILEKKKPNIALYYNKDKKLFFLYDKKEKKYVELDADKTNISYLSKPLYPNTSLIGAEPKKPFSAKILITSSDKTYNILIADLFKTRKILEELNNL